MTTTNLHAYTPYKNGNLVKIDWLRLFDTIINQYCDIEKIEPCQFDKGTDRYTLFMYDGNKMKIRVAIGKYIKCAVYRFVYNPNTPWGSEGFVNNYYTDENYEDQYGNDNTKQRKHNLEFSDPQSFYGHLELLKCLRQLIQYCNKNKDYELAKQQAHDWFNQSYDKLLQRGG